jgi:hypothetical protein
MIALTFISTSKMTRCMLANLKLQIVGFLKVNVIIDYITGTLIRRHRIQKKSSATGQHFLVSDFNVGDEVTFYSRTFKIMGCDEFTRVCYLHNI